MGGFVTYYFKRVLIPEKNGNKGFGYFIASFFENISPEQALKSYKKKRPDFEFIEQEKGHIWLGVLLEKRDYYSLFIRRQENENVLMVGGEKEDNVRKLYSEVIEYSEIEEMNIPEEALEKIFSESIEKVFKE